jgi:CRP/FNR family transcriptional regulator, dissimilatory nitrate respiration regulator
MQALLSTLPLFEALNEKSVERLSRGARQIDAPKGTLLFSPGDTPQGVYVVVSGLVKIAVPTAAEQEKVVTLLGGGKSFGLSALFADEPHIASAAAVNETVVVHVPKAQVLAAMKRDPAFACRVAASLSRRLRELLTEVRSSTAESGTQRTVTFLLSELPHTTSEGAATLTLPAKKRIIASRLALTGEHFSRILHELTSARLISVDGPKVTIPDVGRLRKYVNGKAAAQADGL